MKLEGELREISLIPKLIELSDERFTGAIRFENETEGVIKIVYFKDGNVLSASTNDRSDSIDEILLRSSKVSREHIKQALAKRKENETLGDALLNLGFITKKELAWVRRVQLIGILRSLNRWDNGSYTIVQDYLPKREEGTVFNLQQIVVELIVTEQDRAAVESDLGGAEQVFARTADADERYRQLGLNEDADRIFARVDGTSSASDIASAADMDTFAVFKLLYAFKLLGVIEPTEKPQVKDELSLSLDPLPELPTLDLPLVEEEQQPAQSFDAAPRPFESSVPAPARPLAVETAISEYDDWDTPVASAPKETKAPISPSPARAAAPAMFTRPAKKRSKAPLIALVVLLLLAGAGYGAYLFFGRSPETPAVAVTPRPRPVPTAAVSAPPPVTETSTSTAPSPSTASSIAPTSTSTIAEVAPPPTTTTPATIQPTRIPPVPTTTATPAPTTTAVAASSGAKGDRTRQKFDQMARTYAAESAASPYALQVAFLCEPSSLQNTIESGGANIWFVPAALHGKPCYRVFWGRFTSRADALRSTSQLPAAFRSGRPVAVHVPEVVKP